MMPRRPASGMISRQLLVNSPLLRLGCEARIAATRSAPITLVVCGVSEKGVPVELAGFLGGYGHTLCVGGWVYRCRSGSLAPARFRPPERPRRRVWTRTRGSASRERIDFASTSC